MRGKDEYRKRGEEKSEHPRGGKKRERGNRINADKIISRRLLSTEAADRSTQDYLNIIICRELSEDIIKIIYCRIN